MQSVHEQRAAQLRNGWMKHQPSDAQRRDGLAKAASGRPWRRVASGARRSRCARQPTGDQHETDAERRSNSYAWRAVRRATSTAGRPYFRHARKAGVRPRRPAPAAAPLCSGAHRRSVQQRRCSVKRGLIIRRWVSIARMAASSCSTPAGRGACALSAAARAEALRGEPSAAARPRAWGSTLMFLHCGGSPRHSPAGQAAPTCGGSCCVEGVGAASADEDASLAVEQPPQHGGGCVRHPAVAASSSKPRG